MVADLSTVSLRKLMVGLDELFLNVCKVSNYYVSRINKTYVLIKVLRAQVTSCIIPEKLLLELKEGNIINEKLNKPELDKLCAELKQLKTTILKHSNLKTNRGMKVN